MTIYLDGHATTPLAPEAKSAMDLVWYEPSNAQSPHAFGSRAAQYLEHSRAAVARLIRAAASEITFTSGATEANNIALMGIARGLRSARRSRIVVSALEHHSVLEPARALRQDGLEVVTVPALRGGVVDVQALRRAVDESTLLVSLMLVNNEIGVIQPVREVADIAHAVGALMHTDAAQAGGKLDLDVSTLGADYLSLSAHKLHGPMGVGALYIASGAAQPKPLLHGGGQERGIRPGTVPVPLCAGFGAAADVAREGLPTVRRHCESLVRIFMETLRKCGADVENTCPGADTVPGTAALRLQNADADEVISRLAADVQLSTGSACSAGQLTASHVLRAIGLSEEEARGCIRVCFTRFNTPDEARDAATKLASVTGAGRAARRAN